MKKVLIVAFMMCLSQVWASADQSEIAAEVEPRNAHITKLDLSQKGLTDIEFIKDYPNLEELDLSHNPFISIAPLVNLKNLKKLNLYHSHRIRDSELLGKIISLDSLNIGFIYVDEEIKHPSLEFLRSLKNLEELDISNNYIEKINYLAILPKLKILNLATGYGSSIEDWFSLNHFFTLKELTISYEDRKRFPSLKGVTIKFA